MPPPLPRIETVKLRTGASMPLVGLGTAHLYRDAGRAAIADALDAGYRHVDCAKVYGNESLVGDELARAIAGEPSGADAPGAAPRASARGARAPIPRSELFGVSKRWTDDHAPGDVAAACRRSLRNLRLEYLDLYLIHWPLDWRKGTVLCPGRTPLIETWRAMEKLVDEGLARAIGVSNFDEAQLRDLARDARIQPAVNQVELHPFCQQPELVTACEAMGVAVTAWSPLGKGARALMENPVLERLAAGDGAPASSSSSSSSGGTARRGPADVALRWNTQRGVAVIPKSTSGAHLRANLRAGDGSWALSREGMAAVAGLDAGKRRVPDLLGVWPATANPAAIAAGWVVRNIARAVFAVVPNRVDLMAPQ